MSSVINSVVLAVGALAIALPLGVLLAVLLTRCDVPARKIAIACLGVLLFLPLYVQLSAWDAALGKLGWLTLAIGSLADPLLSGMRGAIFVHGLAAVQWVALIVGIGLLQVDPAQEEAALLAGSPLSVLRRITFRHALPFLAAASLWTVVATIADMTVTNIYLINPSQWTLTERFYMSWSLNLSPLSRMDIVATIVGFSLAVTIAYWILSHSIRNVTESARPLRPRVLFCRSPAIAIFLWLMIALLLILPVANLVSKAGFVVIHEGTGRAPSWSVAKCIAEVAAAPRHYWGEICGTLVTAICAATVAICIAAALAWPAVRRNRYAVLAFAVAVFALIIPGPLVGIALIGLFNHDIPPRLTLADGEIKSWLLALYDNTPLVPILAQAVHALTLTILALWHSFASLNRDVMEAAALDGLSPWRVFWKILVPQRWAAILAAWIMAFAIAAGDLAWCHLVTPPGLDLLSRRIFGLVHSGVEEQVAAISLVIVLNYAVLACFALGLISYQESVSVPRRRHSRL